MAVQGPEVRLTDDRLGSVAALLDSTVREAGSGEQHGVVVAPDGGAGLAQRVVPEEHRQRLTVEGEVDSIDPRLVGQREHDLADHQRWSASSTPANRSESSVTVAPSVPLRANPLISPE